MVCKIDSTMRRLVEVEKSDSKWLRYHYLIHSSFDRIFITVINPQVLHEWRPLFRWALNAVFAHPTRWFRPTRLRCARLWQHRTPSIRACRSQQGKYLISLSVSLGSLCFSGESNSGSHVHVDVCWYSSRTEAIRYGRLAQLHSIVNIQQCSSPSGYSQIRSLWAAS